MKIRFAVAPGAATTDPTGYAELIDGLETTGFDTVWLSDVPLGPSLDPMVGLAFAAARTTRLKLGANVVPIGRNPFVLAKELAQLDVMSGGRLLLSLVPGIDAPGERETLGAVGVDRGAAIEELVPLLRAWWAGEVVEHHGPRFSSPGVALPGRPRQDPLEIWMGGTGPAALARAGRCADGWLGAALTPTEAADARATIRSSADAAGRAVPDDHFGLSIPYSRTPGALVETTSGRLRRHRPAVEPGELLPVGAAALRDLVRRHVDGGLTKFVVRSVTPVEAWSEELSWLGDTLLDLQT